MFRAAAEPGAWSTSSERDFIELLERMTPEEQLRSSCHSFNAHQRATWASRYLEEVPLIHGEFVWIALTSADLD